MVLSTLLAMPLSTLGSSSVQVNELNLNQYMHLEEHPCVIKSFCAQFLIGFFYDKTSFLL